MPNVDLSFAFGLPPEKAVEYFRAKGYTIGWDWRETLHEAHAKAFTVAKVMKVDVLEDIRGAVDRALHDGLTLADFKKDLIPTLQKKGWWGEITHPETGEPAFIDARRLTTIYQTNLQTAYMTGRYQAMMENSSQRPATALHRATAARRSTGSRPAAPRPCRRRCRRWRCPRPDPGGA